MSIYIAESINQSIVTDCRMFWPCRTLSSAHITQSYEFVQVKEGLRS